MNGHIDYQLGNDVMMFTPRSVYSMPADLFKEYERYAVELTFDFLNEGGQITLENGDVVPDRQPKCTA